MPQLGLTDDELTALAGLLREMIAADRFPLSLRVRTLKMILAKFDPAARPRAEPLPAPKPSAQPCAVLHRKRRR